VLLEGFLIGLGSRCVCVFLDAFGGRVGLCGGAVRSVRLQGWTRVVHAAAYRITDGGFGALNKLNHHGSVIIFG